MAKYIVAAFSYCGKNKGFYLLYSKFALCIKNDDPLKIFLML